MNTVVFVKEKVHNERLCSCLRSNIKSFVNLGVAAHFYVDSAKALGFSTISAVVFK